MNEASSRFVDNLVMEKLVSEKLKQVHHVPTADSDELYSKIFDDPHFFNNRTIEIQEQNNHTIRFSSPIKSEYEENNDVTVKIHSTNQDKLTGSIILVHGLFEENREIYNFLINNLNTFGYNIYQTTLPFHYERKPASSLFGGEYFWSANVQRSRNAFKQGVAENYLLYKHLKSETNKPVHFVSFSMGGGVTMSMQSVVDDLDKVFLMNPTCSLSAIVWDSPLCQTIKEDLLNYGWDLDKIVEVYSHFDPATLLRSKTLTNTAIAYGVYDMITTIDQYTELVKKIQFGQSGQYQSGHLNLLRVPKLASDINLFFNKN